MAKQPQEVALEFLEAWAARDWKTAGTHVQLTVLHDWQHPGQPTPPSRLRRLFRWLLRIRPTTPRRRTEPAAALEEKLGHVEILKVLAVGDPRGSGDLNPEVLVDLAARVRIRLGGRERPAEITMRLVRELGPYRASPRGRWGVNPTSCLRIRPM